MKQRLNTGKDMLRQLKTISQSTADATEFFKLLPKNVISPYIELHPDSEIALTWQTPKLVLTIAFSGTGIATYAAFDASSKETRKGRFKINETPEIIHKSLWDDNVAQ